MSMRAPRDKVEEGIISTENVAEQTQTRGEKSQLSRTLASLALTRFKQDGRFGVRQREQLRRALLAVGEAEGWDSLSVEEADPIEGASKDIVRLTRNGVRSMMRDLSKEISTKKAEMKQLKAAAKAIRALAEDRSTTYPAEFSYTHTGKEPAAGLVTKTVELVLNDAEEAEDAAALIDKRMELWGRLNEEMLEKLDQQEQQINEMKGNIVQFVSSTEALMHEVFAVLR